MKNSAGASIYKFKKKREDKLLNREVFNSLICILHSQLSILHSQFSTHFPHQLLQMAQVRTKLSFIYPAADKILHQQQ